MDDSQSTSRNRKWLAATSLVTMGVSASVLLGHTTLKSSVPSTNHDASVSLRRRLQEQQQPIPMYNTQFQAWPPPGQEGQQPQFFPYPPQGFPQGGFQAIPFPFPGQEGQGQGQGQGQEKEQEQGQGGPSPEAAAQSAQGETKPPPLQHELQKQPAQEPEKPPQVSREKYLGMTFPTPEKMPQFLRNTMDHGNDSDLVFFWHIPKTAGSMMKTIMSTCYGLRRAEKLEHPASMVMVKDTVLNVDTASPKGIVEAKEFNIADSGMIDVIISSFVLSASSLFTQSHKGRAFTLLRHPVDTAASNFIKRKGRSKDLRDLELELHQYVSQDWYPDNYMVRQLSGVLPGDAITEHHMDLAKNLLSAKFFIGIVEQMEETVRQLQVYYGWKERPGMEGCVEQFVGGQHETFQLRKRQKPAKDSEEWNMIVEKEKFDMELYYFGLEIFSKQQRMYPSEKKEESFF